LLYYFKIISEFFKYFEFQQVMLSSSVFGTANLVKILGFQTIFKKYFIFFDIIP